MKFAAIPGLLPTLCLAGAAIAATPASEAPVLQEWTVEWGGRSRDPCVGPDGKVWFVGQAGNYIAYFDPAQQTFRRYEIEDGTNPHNLIVDGDGDESQAGDYVYTLEAVSTPK